MNRRILFSVIALFVLGSASLFWFYRTAIPQVPVPRAMPPAVSGDMDAILQTLEAELKQDNPEIGAALLPGITLRELEIAEAALGTPLHAEMRQLYQWHNGLARGAELFPGYEFYPLQDAIELNQDLVAQYKKSGAWLFMAHEAGWLSLFPDAAGDGYYYDPGRDYETGGVFFNFRESSSYIFFPSVRNLLQAIVDCYRQGVYRGGETLDFEREHQITETYGQPVAP